MGVLAQQGERRLTSQEMATGLLASEHHLAKVMQRLAKAGLTDSIRGPQGGLQLGRPAEQITLLAIYEAVEGPLESPGCPLHEPFCDGTDCVLGNVLKSVHEQLRDHFQKTTLAELADGMAFSFRANGSHQTG
jgi:Rrf2 family protein